MIYNKEYLNSLQKERKYHLILLSILIFVTIGILIVLFLSATYNKEVLIKVVSSTLLTLTGWISIFEVCFKLRPLKRNIEHLSLTLRSNLEIVLCAIVQIGKLTTISKEIKGYEILCNLDGNMLRLYFHFGLGNITFNEGDMVRLSIKNNFITGFEVMHNE